MGKSPPKGVKITKVEKPAYAHGYFHTPTLDELENMKLTVNSNRPQKLYSWDRAEMWRVFNS